MAATFQSWRGAQLSIARASEPDGLVDLLVDCHQRIRRFLAPARLGGSQQAAPADRVGQACADVERYFTQAFPLHVADEDESIEPRLRGLSPAVDVALDDAMRQHRQHDPALTALLRAVNLLRSNPEDEVTRVATVDAAEALGNQLEAHLCLEERVVFPAIRELLSNETQTSIIAELRARRRDGRPQPSPTSHSSREID